MAADNPNLHAFRGQAAACRAMGSPLTAVVLEVLADALDDTTETGRAVIAWPGEPLKDALPLRLAGALHALARSGRDDALSKLYSHGRGDAKSILPGIVRDHDHRLHAWLGSPPQTNEVQRSAALMAGLAVAADWLGMPFELLEMGASAGLNLNLDRFGYRFGEIELGGPSAVHLEPEWTGALPPSTLPRLVSRAGVDRNPLDVRDPQIAERLIAYVWPDQRERVARIEAAIKIAFDYPPNVEQGDAGDWIEARLALPQEEGVARAIMHSVFWQYLLPDTQTRIEAAIREAGQLATPERPLVWLSFEPGPNLWTMALTLRLWPCGDELELAHCHPHGAKIEWRG